MQLKTKTDFEDLIRGAKILGCGGGGEESLAQSRVNYLLENELPVSVIDPKDVPPDALLCVSGMVGGRCSPACLEIVSGLEPVEPWPMLSATRMLESFLADRFFSLVSTEIGAGNFLVPILVSARLGIHVLDGDLCGRAKPEISISTSNLVDIPITPLAVVSSFGDQVLLRAAQNDQRAERIARELAVLSGGAVGVARCPARWNKYKEAVIPNTLSKAKNLGEVIRLSRERNKDVIQEIAREIHGSILFQGKVQSIDVSDSGGFVIGSLILTNEQKQKFKIWFKNEFLLSWLDEKLFVTSPDLLCVVDAETGEGLTPWGDDFTAERSVVVLGCANAPLWYSEKGIALFGPKHFGFDYAFKPFSKVISK